MNFTTMGASWSPAASPPQPSPAPATLTLTSQLLAEWRADKTGALYRAFKEEADRQEAAASVDYIREIMRELNADALSKKFTVFDQDRNGTLDADEMMLAFDDIIEFIHAEKRKADKRAIVAQLIALLDTDGDGGVSLAEVLAFVLGEEDAEVALQEHFADRWTPNKDHTGGEKCRALARMGSRSRAE